MMRGVTRSYQLVGRDAQVVLGGVRDRQHGDLLHVAAHVEIESKLGKRFIIF